MNKIGDKLRSFFKEKGLTQDHIADKFGVSQAYVNALLNDKKAFGKKQAFKWSEEFGLSPNWLLTGEGDMFLGDNSKEVSMPPETITMSREVFDQITKLTETILSQQRTIEMMQQERKKMLVQADDVAISAAANG